MRSIPIQDWATVVLLSSPIKDQKEANDSEVYQGCQIVPTPRHCWKDKSEHGVKAALGNHALVGELV